MKKLLSKYWKIFFALCFVVTLISLFVIDSHSPLEILALRVSWLGRAWSVFILPGEMIFAWPLVVVYQFICDGIFGGCPGMLDGGPGEPYFFTAMSLFIGMLYGAGITGIVFFIERFFLKKR